MWSWCVRHLLWPVHERMLRRSTPRYVRELQWSQWLSPDEIRSLQARKLRSLLRHAGENTAYYRQCFHEAEVDPNCGDPFAALKCVPLLDKSEIRRSINDMLWHKAPGGLHERSTGGSTGEPLTFYFDRRRQAYDQAARARTHRWFGVEIGDRELYLWGSPIDLSRTDAMRTVRDRLFNQRLLNAFDMSPRRMDRYLNEWNRFRPVCLFGYPSSIALFALHVRNRAHTLDTRHLRAVFVTGEVCHPHDRKIIADCFGVPVVDGYGSREAGFIAHECPDGKMHITAENVIVEIITDGQTVPVGEDGEIVVTHLDAYAMPFIRYRTGDVGRLLAGRCACGRGLPLMGVVRGRTTDFLHLPDGNVRHALSIIYPLRALTGVSRFRVTQQADYSVTVDIVRDDRTGRVTKEAVARCVRPVLGDAVSLRIEMVASIDVPDSGKHRYVSSNVNPRVPAGSVGGPSGG